MHFFLHFYILWELLVYQFLYSHKFSKNYRKMVSFKMPIGTKSFEDNIPLPKKLRRPDLVQQIRVTVKHLEQFSPKPKAVGFYRFQSESDITIIGFHVDGSAPANESWPGAFFPHFIGGQIMKENTAVDRREFLRLGGSRQGGWHDDKRVDCLLCPSCRRRQRGLFPLHSG